MVILTRRPPTPFNRVHLVATLALGLAAGLTGACASNEPNPQGVPEQQGQQSAATPVPLERATGLRLADAVEPAAYHLRLKVDPREARFEGHALLEAKAAEATSSIRLHARDLTITKASVRSAKGTQEASVSEGAEETIHLDLAAPVSGTLAIEIEYSAPFGKDLVGLYRYQDDGIWYAATQLEATEARSMFPCFDEPRWKTPFSVELTTPAGMEAFANTPEQSRETDTEWETRVFESTKPIPTYLLAIAVGPFDVAEAPAIGANDVRTWEIPLRALASKGKGPQLAFALKHTPAILQALEEYLGTPYPYKKLDLVSVAQFRSGAMENVGLITFTPWLLLLDQNASEYQKFYSKLVISHELAHQWFGNLVTLKWWDDLWLNEAFATFLASETMHRAFPKEGFALRFLDSRFRAFDADSLSSARQIQQPIETHHDIANAFDSITYTKGAQVISAFADWAGAAPFRAGLKNYLGAHQHQSVSSHTFFSTMDTHVGDSWSQAFRTFIKQPGLPHIELTPVCTDEKAVLRAEQSRYLPLGSTGKRFQSWSVPLRIRYGRAKGKEQSKELVLRNQAEEFELAFCPAWIAPDTDRRGYFRWTLPTNMWAQTWRRLDGQGRKLFIDGVQAGVRSGEVKLSDVLASAPRWVRDREAAVRLTNTWTWVSDYLLEESQRPAFEKLMRQWYTQHWKKLDAKKKRSPAEHDAYVQLTGFLARHAQSPSLRARLQRQGKGLVDAILSDALAKVKTPSDLWALALEVAANEEPSLQTKMTQALAKTPSPAIESNLLHGLTQTGSSESVRSVMSMIVDAQIKPHQARRVLRGFGRNPQARDTAWAWVRDNLDSLLTAVPKGHAHNLMALAGSFCSEATKGELQASFGSRVEEIEGGPRSFAKTAEAIDQCVAQKAAQLEHVRAFFEAGSG